MELLVAILITLGFVTPDSFCALPPHERDMLIMSHQPIIDQAMLDPVVMEQAHITMPTLIDRLED